MGWGLPLVPAGTYASVMQVLLGSKIGEAIPRFSGRYWWVGNLTALALLAYQFALIDFGFHMVMCVIGRVFGMREVPPPYEFFLVRSSGAFMWFAVAWCLMGAPRAAREPGAIGYLASFIVAVPLIWVALFLVAGHSWLRAGSSGKVGLKEMYQSERFVQFMWRTQCTLVGITFATLILLAIYLRSNP
jgi:hypothetical protein